MRLLALFLLVSTAGAQQMKSRIAEGFDSIQAARLKADLTFLSSDALEGRRSLERGSEVAIQWIASQFGKAGLKPVVGDSYLQPVPIIEYTADRALTLAVRPYHAPDAVANFASEVSVSGPGRWSSGYGISAPELAYDDYAGVDAKGKIVLISLTSHKRTTQVPSSTAQAIRATRMRLIRRSMQRHGAIGIRPSATPTITRAGRRGGRAGRKGRAPDAGRARGRARGFPVNR